MRGRRRLGTFFDLLGLAFSAYTMIVTTPLGGLVADAGFRLAGLPRRSPPLASYFQEGPRGAPLPATDQLGPAAIAAAPSEHPESTQVATRLGVRPSLARAVVVMATANERATPEEALVTTLAELSDRLDSEEGAVAALVTDARVIEQAIARARGSGAPTPGAYREFRPFLRPDHRLRVDPFVRGSFALATAYEMLPPLLEPARLSSSFGPRIHPVLGSRRMHTGIDLAVPAGTQIRAIAAGTVTHASEDSINGKLVKLDHGYGLTSAYCHISSAEVQRGDHVQRGARIALSGQTGRVTGPHLHFQLELDGTPIDPALFLGGAFLQASSSLQLRSRRTGEAAAR